MNKRNNGINLQNYPKLSGSKNKTPSGQAKKCNNFPKKNQNCTKSKTNSCNNIKKSQQEAIKFKKAEVRQQSLQSRNQHVSLYNMNSNLDKSPSDSHDNAVYRELDSDESMCSINFHKSSINVRNTAGEEHSDDSSETSDSNFNASWHKDESDSQNDNDYDTENYSSSLDEDYMQYFQSSDDKADYKLLRYFSEDLIIYKAKKRDFNSTDDIKFNSDADESRVIERHKGNIAKTIVQPHTYNKEEFGKLFYQPNKSFPHSITDPLFVGDDSPVLSVTDDSAKEVDPNWKLGSSNCKYLEEKSSIEINTRDIESVCSLKQPDSSLVTSNQEGDDDDESFSCNKSLEEFQTEVIDNTQCYNVEVQHCLTDWNTSNDINNIEYSEEYQLSSELLAESTYLNDKSSVWLTDVVDYDESQAISEDEGDLNENSYSSLCSDSDFCIENAKFEVPRETTENATPVGDVLTLNVSNPLFRNDEKIFVNNESKTMPSKFKEISKCSIKSCQTINDSNTQFFDAILDNAVVAVVKKPFYIYGTLSLTLISGAVQIYGHSPNPNQEIEIFSPRGYCMVEVASQPSQPSKDWQHCLEPYKTYFSVHDIKEIMRRFKVGKDALVILKANHSSKRVQQQFQKFMDQNIFPSLQSVNMNRPLYNIEYKLNCIINTVPPKENCLTLQQIWQNFTINQQSKVMVAGGKSVGKSTLIRFLLNKYISVYPRILLIDLDIGQPEIFVPETISCTLLTKPLIGPGFLLNLQPDKAFAIGHVDILLCCPTYIQATKKLISYCIAKQEYKHIPWLVNTMGYNRGFALELMTVILQELPITDLIQLQSNKEINNFTEFLYPDVLNSMQSQFILDIKNKVPEYRLHIWKSPMLQESCYQKQWKMRAKDTRYAILLTRLSAAFINDEEWLTDCQPKGAPLDEVKFVKLLENKYEDTLVVKAANVNLVYLCHYADDASVMECFGIGVIRAIDYNIRRVFLITAMPFDQLKYVNCLALGDISLPSTLFTTQGPKVKNKAQFVCDTLDIKASKAVQHFHRRLFNFPKKSKI